MYLETRVRWLPSVEGLTQTSMVKGESPRNWRLPLAATSAYCLLADSSLTEQPPEPLARPPDPPASLDWLVSPSANCKALRMASSISPGPPFLSPPNLIKNETFSSSVTLPSLFSSTRLLKIATCSLVMSLSAYSRKRESA